MAVDIVNALVGGGVGVGMDVLLKLGVEIIKRGLQFGPTLESSRNTLNTLAPLVEEITSCNRQLENPIPGLEGIQVELRKGNELVHKCSKPNRLKRFFLAPLYQTRLKDRDEELQRKLAVEGQAQILTGVMKILEILERVSRENFGGNQQMRSVGGAAPPEPELKGMEEPLRRLKGEVLKDDEPVTMLTGLGGSGKTTLAKKICWDPQVQRKFGGNIFFVNVSQMPDVKNIVQKLFEDCGFPVSKFETNSEDAINKLGVVLMHVHNGKIPILLVLDDVWDRSGALVDKFKFQIPGYKILVTSRVAFERFGTPIRLEQLPHDDAVSIFSHYAKLDSPDSSTSYKPNKKLINEIVERCRGSPLALKVTGGSLCKQRPEAWKIMKEGLQSQGILEYSCDSELLHCLQQSLDILEVKYGVSKKECFMDLGLFPEDQRIHVPTLIDIWAELHNLDDDNGKGMDILSDLDARNLIKLIETRQVAREEDMYYNYHFVVLHDLLRELAILQSNQEQFDRTKKLIIELNGDITKINGNEHPEWKVGQNQQGIINYIWSLLTWWTEKKELRVAAQVLSISTDENFASDWIDMQADEAEVLVLNVRSRQYSLPEFTKKMSKLKVLVVTNYGFHHSKLNKFELLGSLAELTRIRLEKVSVPCLCILKNLRKLSLRMCNIGQAFENPSIPISEAMPNLVEMSIDYCKDLVKLPDGICNITLLKKLNITNCHKLSVLPDDIAKLENLEVLRLSSCLGLKVMPDSVGGLHKLRCLDISDCISLAELPEDIGELQAIEKLYLKGCSGLRELPYSFRNFGKLEHDIDVICDEERNDLWKNSVPNFSNVKVETLKEKITLTWLSGHGVRS